jgi:Meckel syndrome type 1 protein
MEILSALFDGELEGDTARFAMKRLGHDAQWRQAFGNWQLLGDALRGDASIAAPSDFAARVAAAVSAEPALVAPSLASAAVASAASARPDRCKWIGGAALAASVAMVAMFVARPFSQESAITPGSAATATTEFAAEPAATPKAPAAVTPSAPDAVIEVGAAALAVAELPRRAGERRSRGQSQRAALRAPRRQLSSPASGIAAGSTSALAVIESQPVVSASPFHPQHAEIASRPWPRAVLPAASSTGGFTTSYGSGAASSPSFYPFEPRLPNAVDVAPALLQADDQNP